MSVRNSIIRCNPVQITRDSWVTGIPGHDQPGEELVHETLKVEADPLSFEFHGRCGFAARFDYRN